MDKDIELYTTSSIIKCKICGKDTCMVTTNTCSNCFELDIKLTGYILDTTDMGRIWLKNRISEVEDWMNKNRDNGHEKG